MIDLASTVIIANPTSGAGRVAAQWDAIMAALRQHLGHVEVLKTGGPGDGARLARAAVERGARTLLSMGGDGTHNEVVNGIMAAGPAPGEIRLGILPAGTGGDFRRLLRGGQDIDTSIEALASPTAHPIDLIRVDFREDDGTPAQRHFLNMASFGMGGLICRIANASSKRLGGKATFFLATVLAWTRYRTAAVRVSVDGVLVGDFHVSNVMVANGQFSGGGMWMAPHARLGDGLLDVLIIRKANALAEARLFNALYTGEHIPSPHITCLSGRTVTMEVVNGRRAWIDLDGEAPGILPATATVVPGAIELLNALPDAL